ncbi:MAG TPA: ABC transporter substrate-binding protein [Acetobacteraceae bacterium]|nr:ABC transporter substrate-binding protein [Acetobacteraceae bacterium]
MIRTLLSTALLALAAALPARAQDRVLLQLDWIPTGEHAAYFSGAVRGAWREQGIELSLTRGYGSGDTVNKVAAGTAAFGVADISAVMTARARQNAPVRSIMQIYTHSPHSLFVLRSSGIQNFQGLEGRRIGITPGNSHRLYFPEVARRAGTNPDRITWVNTDASAMAALLISRRIDAAPFFAIHHYYQNKAARRAGEEIVVLPFVETGFAIYATTLIATDETIQRNPDLVRRFLRGATNAFTWANENQEQACRMHVQRNPEVELDDCQGSLRATLSYVFNEHQRQTGFGRQDPARLRFTWEQVASSQQLDANWDFNQAMDLRHLP